MRRRLSEREKRIRRKAKRRAWAVVIACLLCFLTVLLVPWRDLMDRMETAGSSAASSQSAKAGSAGASSSGEYPTGIRNEVAADSPLLGADSAGHGEGVLPAPPMADLVPRETMGQEPEGSGNADEQEPVGTVPRESGPNESQTESPAGMPGGSQTEAAAAPVREVSSSVEITASDLDEYSRELAARFGNRLEAIYQYIRTQYTYRSSPKLSVEAMALRMFNRGSGACYDFSAIAYYLFRAAGYNNYIVTGTSRTGEEHSWNLVEMSPGIWRHIDVSKKLVTVYGMTDDELRAFDTVGNNYTYIWDDGIWTSTSATGRGSGETSAAAAVHAEKAKAARTAELGLAEKAEETEASSGWREQPAPGTSGEMTRPAEGPGTTDPETASGETETSPPPSETMPEETLPEESTNESEETTAESGSEETTAPDPTPETETAPDISETSQEETQEPAGSESSPEETAPSETEPSEEPRESSEASPSEEPSPAGETEP